MMMMMMMMTGLLNWIDYYTTKCTVKVAYVQAFYFSSMQTFM